LDVAKGAYTNGKHRRFLNKFSSLHLAGIGIEKESQTR
jgi:hypothetical protein